MFLYLLFADLQGPAGGVAVGAVSMIGHEY
jgi:hypothetical protein